MFRMKEDKKKTKGIGRGGKNKKEAARED